MPAPTFNDVVGAYIKLRSHKELIEKRQKLELGPLNDQMNKLEAWALKTLQEQGQESARTENGTVFIQTDTSVTVDDFHATLAYIRDNNLWEMLERRVSKTVVLDLIQSTNELPPGLKLSSRIVCKFRKS